MKFLFLDFDGVLNHEKFYDEQNKLSESDKKGFPYNQFDPECIKRVNRIIDETSCNLVISSSWRFDKNLYTIIKRIGIKLRYYEMTPYALNRMRGEEIKMYLESKNINDYKYCIIDDDKDFYKFQKPFFVHTNSFVGLTDEDTEKAIKILNS